MTTSPLVASVRIPGHWRDAWLYKQHLIVWRRDNTMLSVPLDRLLSLIGHAWDTHTATAHEYLLLRNDWKSSEQFRKLVSLPGVAKNLRSAIQATGGEITLDVDSLGFEPMNVEPAPGALLDSHIYANRIYCASTDGLYESYLHPTAGEFQLEELMSRRVADVSAKYGCLNVSAEEEGLWYQPILLGEHRLHEKVRPFERVADVSLGNSYASRHLLNYVEGGAPQFLRAQAQKHRVVEGADYDEWQVSGYQKPRDIRRAAISALSSKSRVALDEASTPADSLDDFEVEVLGNADYRLLVQWKNRLQVLDISAYENKQIALRPDQRFKMAEKFQLDVETVLETYAIGSGFLVETFNEIRLLTETGSHPFFAGPAAKVRTFESSRRHKDVAAVVSEDALHLVGFMNEV